MATTTTFVFDRTIEAMLDREANNWTIARALVDELVPEGNRNEIPKTAYAALAEAQRVAGLEPWDYSRARNYRRTAAMFGAADVVPGLSWSAHLVASDAGNLTAASAAIQAVAANVDGDMTRVAVTAVRAHVRNLNKGNTKSAGRKSTSGKVGTLSVAAVATLAGKIRNKANFIAPLVKAGKVAELKASLATVESFTAWLSDGIDEAMAKAAGPTNISATPSKDASKTGTTKKAGRTRTSRGN